MQQLFSHTWNIACRLDLPDGVDMVMPGKFQGNCLILFDLKCLKVTKSLLITDLFSARIQTVLNPKSQVRFLWMCFYSCQHANPFLQHHYTVFPCKSWHTHLLLFISLTFNCSHTQSILSILNALQDILYAHFSLDNFTKCMGLVC